MGVVYIFVGRPLGLVDPFGVSLDEELKGWVVCGAPFVFVLVTFIYTLIDSILVARFGRRFGVWF